MNHNSRTSTILGYGFLLASFLLIIHTTQYCFGAEIWYDELFSVGLVPRSFGKIIAYTAQDVHPPLYYFYIKCIYELIHIFLPSVAIPIAAKFASILPMLLLFLYSLLFFRKRFGLFTTALFLWCVYTMPQILSFAVEIRMYSLALFLVTVAFYHALEIAHTQRSQDWFLLGLFGLLTAYTQYFSGLAIVGIYLTLFIWLFLKNRAQLKYWCITVGISFLCYLPWLIVLMRQLGQVSNHYWIQPLTIRSIFGCAKYIFLPSGYPPTLTYGVALFFIIGFLGLLICYIRKRLHKGREEQLELFHICCGFSGLFFLILVGFLVSILVQPIFIYRYMIPALGGLWLVFAIVLNDIRHKAWIFIPFLCVMGLSSKWTLDHFHYIEDQKLSEGKRTETMLSTIDSDDILIYNFDHVQGVVGYYLDNESYLWCGTAEPLIKELYRPYGSINNTEELLSLLHTGRTVWYFGSFNAREEIIALWLEDGIVATEVDNCLLEQYWFKLYTVSLAP